MVTCVKRSRIMQLVVSLEAFGEELVVAVVVAKHADEVAIEFLEVGDGEG